MFYGAWQLQKDAPSFTASRPAQGPASCRTGSRGINTNVRRRDNGRHESQKCRVQASRDRYCHSAAYHPGN